LAIRIFSNMADSMFAGARSGWALNEEEEMLAAVLAAIARY
jgi:hypothetical protein